MKIETEFSALRNVGRPVVLAAGCIDGVHLGHREVIETAVSKAHGRDSEAWVLTFDRHPLQVLKPHKAPRMLTTREQKMQLLRELGTDGVLELSFTEEFSKWPADYFIEQLHEHISSLAELVVGENWTFGYQARGDVDLLKRYGPMYGFKTTIVSPILWKGEPVSSTRIRQALREGNLPEAHAMLGRPFSLRGRVVEGRRVGHQLGYPTANLRVPPHIEQPKPGIYAVMARMDGEERGGAAYFGRRPTFAEDDHHLIMEIYLFEWDADLYGRDLEVTFIKYLRGDQKFESTESLVAQIKNDVETARRVLRRNRHYVPDYEI